AGVDVRLRLVLDGFVAHLGLDLSSLDLCIGHTGVVSIVDRLGLADKIGAGLYAGIDVSVGQHLGFQRVALSFQLGDFGVLIGQGFGVCGFGVGEFAGRVGNRRLQLRNRLLSLLSGFNREGIDNDLPQCVSHGMASFVLRVVLRVIQHTGVALISDA